VGWYEDGLPERDELAAAGGDDAAIGSFYEMCGRIEKVLSRSFYSGAAEVHTELPFAVVIDGSVVQGMLDRVVFDGDLVDVIDFKTDSQVDVERYRPQMEAYRRAVSEIYGGQVRVRLVFVNADDGVREI
jgi:ATP-dependent exoDNAse (exonuclease V) beta subunit